MFEFLCELLGLLMFEAVTQASLHAAGRKRRAPAERFRPWLLVPGYLLLGAIAGGLSVLLFPEYLIRSEAWRILYLAIGPIVVAAAIALLGRLFRRRIRIDRFAYAWMFAFAFALVRYCNAH